MCINKDLGGFVNHNRLAEVGLGMYERRYEGQADGGGRTAELAYLHIFTEYPSVYNIAECNFLYVRREVQSSNLFFLMNLFFFFFSARLAIAVGEMP